MKFSSPRGYSIVGIRKVILAEIDFMLGNLEFNTFEHYRALAWFRERLIERLER